MVWCLVGSRDNFTLPYLLFIIPITTTASSTFIIHITSFLISLFYNLFSVLNLILLHFHHRLSLNHYHHLLLIFIFFISTIFFATFIFSAIFIFLVSVFLFVIITIIISAFTIVITFIANFRVRKTRSPTPLQRIGEQKFTVAT